MRVEHVAPSCPASCLSILKWLVLTWVKESGVGLGSQLNQKDSEAPSDGWKREREEWPMPH